MTDKAGPNWTKRGVMVAIGLAVATMLCMTLNNAPTLVPFLEERGYNAAWLMPALQWLQRALWVIVALVACALAVYVVRRYWQELTRLFKWVTAPLRWFYVSLLWHLVIRPARDHRGLMLSAEGQHDLFKHMGRDSLRVLAFVAEAHLTGKHAVDSGEVWVEPSSWSRQTRSVPAEVTRSWQVRACDELLAEGFLVKAEWSQEDEVSVLVRLPLWCTLGGGARAVLRGARLELDRRARAEWEAGHEWPA